MNNSIGNIILPEDWNIVQISDLSVRITKGTTPSSYGFEYTNSGVNYIKVESITDSGKFKKEMFAKISQEAHEKLSRSQFEEGDLLITIAGNLGRTAIVTKDVLPANTNQAVAIVKLKKESLSVEYVQFFLQGFSIKQYIQMVSTVGAQPNLSLKQIGEMAVALPSLEEQSKISAILTCGDEAIEKTEAIIEQTEKVQKRLMQELLTKGVGHREFKKTEIGEIPAEWDVSLLKNISTKITDGAHHTPKYTKHGIPFLRVTDLKNNKIDFTKTKYISKEEHASLIKRCRPERGDILLSKNGTIGITKTIDWEEEFSIFVSLCLIKLNRELVIPKYIEYFLRSEVAWQQIRLRSKQGTVTNLHLIEIKELICGIPPIEEQEEIVKIAQSIENKLEIEKLHLSQLKAIKKGLMQDLLTGKIRVQFDEPEVVSS